ncbi:ATP-dependent DNA helicase RecG [Spirosoma fluviale]|uniref:ATP-dependent DNA helicase RecG n=2 Tax=Spirosoma fluviale TaxID=1597977 RepID=A0A286G3U7_9BACT|nr:ATP-dependent DNA helicase RecG [Spirosoma fluviale]
MYSAKELLDQLNSFDECNYIEAKSGTSIDRSIMETVCSFSNEPGMGGGYILLGVRQDDMELFPAYKPIVLTDPDKIQRDLASRCASEFNIPVRPDIEIEKVHGYYLLKVYISELALSQKPIYFKHKKLPEGAYRRIGSTDQSCTDDDMVLFYNHNESYDSGILSRTTFDDIDLESVLLYRKLRAEVNSSAEELTLDDKGLLISLGCANQEKSSFCLTVAGLILFGKATAQRRLMPMLRTDYIRVPGNEWVADPVNRFSNIDMRGPMLRMIYRAINTVADDLPRGFMLPEGEIQAQRTGLPTRVLREALVNAFMHRSYKVQQPLQIIRYSNRLEIVNPGFSLKSEEQLGEPGSKTRNPFIASVFHETNLAETKGSGIRTMRKLMEAGEMAPPTFESNHSANEFTARLLLHHFLGEEQLEWLSQFDSLGLNLDQKKALIFLKGVGAINNPTYRQIAGCDTLKASSDLRKLREFKLIEQKGKSTATYYIPSESLQKMNDSSVLLNDSKASSVAVKEKHTTSDLVDDARSLTDNTSDLADNARSITDNARSITDNARSITDNARSLTDDARSLTDDARSLTDNTSDLTDDARSLTDDARSLTDNTSDLTDDARSITDYARSITDNALERNYNGKEVPEELKQLINNLGKRKNEKVYIHNLIESLCSWQSLTLQELSQLLSRSPNHLFNQYVKPMLDSGDLEYIFPDMPKHPQQAYKAISK